MGNKESNSQGAPRQHGISVFRNSASMQKALKHKAVHGTRQLIAGVLAVSMLPLSLGTSLAQDYGAPPPPPDYEDQTLSNYQPLAPEQLDQLVAPIALYPDTLVAQVLAGATYPAQIASAEQFLEQSGNYPPEQLAEIANTQPWDPSVKSLVAFPQVLNNMTRNMDWTTQLGNAYYNQPQDVLGAVQAMRQRAYAAGSLRTTPQLSVEYDPGDIVIAPVSPTVVYVPYYDPWVVYGAPIPIYRHYYYGPPRGVVFASGLALGFGIGLAVGAFTHYGWGYHSWQPDWRSRAIVYNHDTYISHSVTVINHGNYGHYDRAPEARAFNQAQGARYGGGYRNINNVPVERGNGVYNRGGNTISQGNNDFNRGRGGPNNGGTQTIQPTPGLNRGGVPANNPTYNRGNYGAPQSGAGRPQGNFGGGVQGNPARPQGNYGAQQGVPQGGYGARQGGYGGVQNGVIRPQGNYGGPQGGYAGPQGVVRPQSNPGGAQNIPVRPQGNYGVQQGNPGSAQGNDARSQGSYGARQGGYGGGQNGTTRPQGNFGGVQGGYAGPQGGGAGRPQGGGYEQGGGYNRGGYNQGGGQPNSRPSAPPPQQQHSAPQQQQPMQNNGGGHDNHGGGGDHGDHHR